MKELHWLTDLQIALLDPIWERGEATVREVHAAQIESLGLALKTVGTVLRRLEGQGFLEHREEGRQFVYQARVSREEVRTAVLGAVTESLFEGSTEALVAHALNVNGTEEHRREETGRGQDRLAG